LANRSSQGLQLRASTTDVLSMREGTIQTAPSLLILGGGALATECYIPALCRLGWEKGVMVIDTSEAAAVRTHKLCPAVRTRIGDYAAILKDRRLISEFNGLVVAVPNCLHEDAVISGLDAGLDVLCEKPLAMNVNSCLRLAGAAEQRGRKLAVAMVRRFIPSVTVIRDSIQHGLIGDVRDVEIEHGGSFHWPAQSGSYFRKENGGLFLNMGIHYLDMIENWFGPLEPIEYADDAAGGVEANCKLVLRSQTGVRVRLRLSYTHELANCISVRGTQGEIRARVDDFATAKWTSHRTGLSGDLRPEKPFSSDTLPPDFVSSFAEQFIRFREVIAGRREPDVNALQAASTQQIIEWGYSHRRPMYPAVGSRSGSRPSLKPARTVVTGGSGFLGLSLVERLCGLGFTDIVVPIRSHQSGANLGRFSVNPVLTNLLDMDSVRAAVAGAKYVFHLAYGTTGADPARITIEGTKNVVEAAIEAGVESLVVVSTATVFGHPKTNQPVDETFPYRPGLGEYGASKATAEKYALRKAKSSGQTRIAVINPSAIYGPNGKLFTEFPVRAATAGQLAWIELGKGKFNFTFVENVVDALLLAASCEKAHGQNFIISDGVCTFREFLSLLLGPLAETLPSYTRSELVELERRSRPSWSDLVRGLMNEEVMRAVRGIPLLNKPKRLIEKRLPKMHARLRSRKQTLRDGKIMCSPRNANQPPSWLADIFGPIEIEYSSAKARKILGWCPAVSLEGGVAACSQWLRAMDILTDKRQ
jgi:predicted dehydrogenase/nucleoside-diphosphate-sugar epimerase